MNLRGRSGQLEGGEHIGKSTYGIYGIQMRVRECTGKDTRGQNSTLSEENRVEYRTQHRGARREGAQGQGPGITAVYGISYQEGKYKGH